MAKTTLPSRGYPLVCVLALAAPALAQDPTSTPPSSPPSNATVSVPAAPEGTDALAARLRARHVRDLPHPSSLRAPHDRARLRWIAEHHRLLVVRARALLLLAEDSSAETRVVILRVLDGDAPAIVRAAALRATEAWPLDASLRARLERLARETDPRLGPPARARLGG